jgi:hypothetical protein
MRGPFPVAYRDCDAVLRTAGIGAQQKLKSESAAFGFVPKPTLTSLQYNRHRVEPGRSPRRVGVAGSRRKRLSACRCYPVLIWIKV